MNWHKLYVWVSLLAALLLTDAALAGDGGPRKVFTKLNVKFTQPQPLVGDTLIQIGPDGTSKSIPVELVSTYYEAEISTVTDGVVRKKWDGHIRDYELRSKDPKHPYTWIMWSSYPLGRFSLFSYANGKSYLAWSSGYVVEFVDVSHPRYQGDATEYILNKDKSDLTDPFRPVAVNLRDLIEWQELHTRYESAFFLSIDILSIAKDKNGNWVVQIKGPNSERVYTIVQDASEEKGWRLVE